MGAKTLIPVEEYLRTPYEGSEPDYVDGEIVERSMPNNIHSRAVTALILIFFRQAGASLFGRPELRIPVVQGRYRVADLAVFDHDVREEVPQSQPLIVIEVLSPDDSHAELMRRFADYAAVGVPNIWLVDPITQCLSIYHDRSLTASAVLAIPGYNVAIRPADIWS